MIFIVGFIFIILAIMITIIQSESHDRQIREKIESMGGTVVSIERKYFNSGPFLFIGKGRSVYKIEYQMNQRTYEGWVRFGGLFGPDWKL